MKKSLFVIILWILSIFFICFDYEKKDYSNQYVKLLEDTSIYRKEENKFKVIGTLYEGTTLKIKNMVSDYLHFGEEYYIKTNHLEQVEEGIDDYYKKYIPFNEIITMNPTILYKEKKAYQINQDYSFRVLFKDSEYYYVLFQEELLKVKKEDILKLEEDNTYESATSISVLDFSNITSLTEYFHLLKDYTTIDLEEYHKWLNNEIELPKKSVLLLGNSNQSEELNQIYMSNDFNQKNEAATKENPYNSYIVTDNIEEFKKMLNREKIYDMSILATSIPVLNYHFFTDGGLACNETICLHTDKFRSHLQYFKDNDYKVLRIQEFIDWIYGRIELPKKSVLLTIDDGACGTSFVNGNLLIPILEEYKMPATLFLVTSWWDPNNYKSDYLEVESHSYDLHKIGTCGNQNIDCLNKNELYEDLKKSSEILGSKKAFAYPFYNSNPLSREVLKELGFDVAFTGGDRNATREDVKYLLPRYPIYSNITLEQLEQMVN